MHVHLKRVPFNEHAMLVSGLNSVEYFKMTFRKALKDSLAQRSKPFSQR